MNHNELNKVSVHELFPDESCNPNFGGLREIKWVWGFTFEATFAAMTVAHIICMVSRLYSRIHFMAGAEVFSDPTCKVW